MSDEEIKFFCAQRGLSRVVLFQSLSQFASYFICAIVSVVLVCGFCLIFHITMDLYKIFPACFGGALLAVVLSMKFTLIYSGGRPEVFMKMFLSTVARNGYRVCYESAGKCLMSQKLPSFLKWAESAVTVEMKGRQVQLSGPWLVAQSCNHAARRLVANL